MAADFYAEVEHVARLARINLNDKEKEKIARQLNDILERAEKIQEIDTDGVEPTAHVIEMPAFLRDDLVKPSLDLGQVLQNAPRRQDNYFRVPRINKLEEAT